MEASERGAGGESVRAASRIVLFALLILSPLPFGSVQRWSVLGVETVAALLGIGVLWIVSCEPGAVPRHARLPLLAIGTLLLVGALQLVPLPPSAAELLAGPTAAARESLAAVVPETRTSFAPLSLSPADGLDALLRLLAYALVGLAAALSFPEPAHLRQAMAVVVFSGAFQALYGAAEYLSGHQHIFAYAKEHELDSATGTFINSNHYAGYLAMTLPLALGLLLARWPASSGPRSWRARIVLLGQASGFWRVSALFAALLIWAGILLSYSRSGLAVALLGSGWLVVKICRRRRQVVLVGLVFLVPALYLSTLAVRAPGEDFAAPSGDLATLGYRLPLWEQASRMVPSYAVLGSGFGTFEAGFMMYGQPPRDLYVDHLHNDWLQTLIEGGLVSLVALCVLLGAVLVRRRTGTGFDPRQRLPAASLQAAIALMAFQSLVEFSVRIPSVAVLLAFLAGLSCSAGLREVRLVRGQAPVA